MSVKMNGELVPLRLFEPPDVYFIESNSGLIKIGHSREVPRRLATLRFQRYPEQLRLVALVRRGGRGMETRLHRRFAAARVHGEWFRPVPALLSLIASSRATLGAIR